MYITLRISLHLLVIGACYIVAGWRVFIAWAIYLTYKHIFAWLLELEAHRKFDRAFEDDGMYSLTAKDIDPANKNDGRP
jgi:hypothetical protein